MVVVDYESMFTVYEEIKQGACGRQACSVMIIVANEVDAMASAKILTQLLRSDNVAYKIRPVANFTHVLESVDEFAAMDIRTVFLINCGSMYNIPKLFGLERGGDLRCFILDNHRPVHLANIHSRHNVVVLDNESVNLEEIPSDGSDLSSVSDSSDDSDDDGEDSAEVGGDSEGAGDLSDLDSQEGDNGEESEDGELVEGEPEDEELVNGEPEDGELVERGPEDGELVEGEPEDREHEDGESDEGELRVGANDNDEGEADEEVVVGKKRKALAEKYDPLKARRRSLEQYYSQGTSYTVPTAVMLVNLVKKLNRSCTNDILWQAILGATDQYHRCRISEGLYEAICNEIKRELPDDSSRGKYTVGEGVEEVAVPGAEAGHIQPGSEYRFYMCRHWSLFEAMSYSNYISSKLMVWKVQGALKLQEMLAKMGVSLQQCRQTYNYMNPTLRNHFRKQITGEVAEEFGLIHPGPLYKSFYRYNSFKNPVSASDVVYAVTALLEISGDESLPLDCASTASGSAEGNDELPEPPTREDAEEATGGGEDRGGGPAWTSCFNKAYDCLSMRPGSSEETLRRGITTALSLQKAIVGQASAMLERYDSITRLKCFRYALVSRSAGGSGGEGAAGASTAVSAASADSIFGRPAVLTRLAHFLMDVQRENGAWAGRRAKPLLVAAEKRGSYLIVGVSPLAWEEGEALSRTSKFRKLFELAAKEANAESRQDGFDSSIIEVGKQDVMAFIENLMWLMTQ